MKKMISIVSLLIFCVSINMQIYAGDNNSVPNVVPTTSGSWSSTAQILMSYMVFGGTSSSGLLPNFTTGFGGVLAKTIVHRLGLDMTPTERDMQVENLKQTRLKTKADELNDQLVLLTVLDKKLDFDAKKYGKVNALLIKQNNDMTSLKSAVETYSFAMTHKYTELERMGFAQQYEIDQRKELTTKSSSTAKPEEIKEAIESTHENQDRLRKVRQKTFDQLLTEWEKQADDENSFMKKHNDLTDKNESERKALEAEKSDDETLYIQRHNEIVEKCTKTEKSELPKK